MNNKTFVFIVLAGLCLLLCSCANTGTAAPSPSSPAPAGNEAEAGAAPTGGTAPMGGDVSDFDRLFISAADDAGFLDDLIGKEANEEFINKVIEPAKWEPEQLPLIYKAIKHFGFDKADFAAVNDDRKRAFAAGDESKYYFTDEVIDALFSNDEQEVRRVTRSPCALYCDDTLYTATAVLGMSEATAKALPVSEDALDDYIRSVIEAMDAQGYTVPENRRGILEAFPAGNGEK